MVNTKFGKRLFGLFLAFICVFALIGCNKDAQIKEAALKDAQEKVDEIYSKIYWSKDSMSQVTADVKGFITETLYENVTVSWESSEEDILSATGKVTLPSWEDERNVVVKEATEDEPAVKVVPVKVTATITGVAEWEVKGKTYTQEVTAVKEFNFTVKALAEGADKVETILSAKQKAAAYIYDEKGVARDCSVSGDNSAFYTTTVKGVVVAVLASGGQFMVHDGTDGIYVYVAVEGIKVGDQVTIAGDIMTYYASLQFGKQSNVTIEKNGTAKAGEYREVTAQELETEASELMEDGKSLKKAGFLGGELVNVYGKLNYDGANSLTGERYYIADAITGERVWIYRSSYEEDKPAALEAMLGKYVKVRGVTYGRDSRLQKCRIVWDGTIVEAEGVEVSEAQQVQIALNSVSCPAEAKENFELSAVEGVANYAWTVVSGTGIELEGLNAKVTRTEADQTVVLKLEITIGATTDSKEFTVKVPKKVAEADPNAGYVDLTVTTLDLAFEKYAAGTVEYAGVKFEYTELGNYGNGIQMRIKEGRTSTLWNTTAFAKPIVKIELAIAASKKAYDNDDALIFSFGNAADGLNEEVKLSTVADNKTYVVTPSAATHTFFKVQHNLSKNSGYWDYIRVWFEDGIVDVPTPEPDPEPNPEVKYETSVEAGVEYYLSFYQEQNAKHLFPNGEMKGYYGATVENAADAKKVALEATEGGYYLYFVGDTKTYINVIASVSNGKTYNNVKYQSEATSVWTFNEEYDTLTTVVGETTVYLGTYGTNVTVGASAISFAATSYVAHLYKVENAPVNGTVEPDPEPDPEPTEGTTIKVSIADYADKNSWVNSTKYDTVILDENVTVEATGTDSNTGKYYESGENWRMYQTGTPSIVFTAKEGYVIKTVKVTYASQNTGALTLNGTTVASNTAVEVNASSVTFSVGNTGDATNGQARISAIEVVYAPVAE